jgi:hypothetical protein
VSAAPTEHQLRAMLRAARLVDSAGNSVLQVRAAYRATATKGEHTAADLEAAEDRLVDAGLLARDAGKLLPDARLASIVRADDVLALSLLRRAARELSPAEAAIARAVIGQRGEEHVVLRCREELDALGRQDLSQQVQRVSLVSDSLGYDVWAPSIGAAPRRLEVKTSSLSAVGSFEFFISRNEFEVGRREPTTWALVACQADGERVADIGWCRAAALGSYLPEDQNGQWTEARVRLPVTVLAGGLPPAL